MQHSVDDLNDTGKFRLILRLPFSNMLSFVLDYLRRKSVLIYSFWGICIFFFFIAFDIRISIAGYFPWSRIFFHSMLGFVFFPIAIIPVHEGLHIIAYYFSGAKHIRVGMELKQFLFYATAHKFVADRQKFKLVALVPFIVISITILLLIYYLPGLWKWSFSAFLFVHSTMCAGDFAILNFYFLNRNREIFTFDDADMKEACFYEKI